MIFRSANSNDIDKVFKIIISEPELYCFEDAIPEDYVLEMIIDGRVILAVEDDEIIGIVAGESLIYEVGLIHWIWIKPEKRGTIVFDKLIEKWKEPFTYVLLYGNDSAVKAFTKRGFHKGNKKLTELLFDPDL